MARGTKSLIVRHWRGELSLKTSFWVFGVLLPVIIVLGIAALTAAAELLGLAWRPLGVVKLALLLLAALLLIWIFVGIWRAASWYPAQGGKPAWAWLAKLGVLLALSRLLFEVYQFSLPLVQDDVILSSNGGHAQQFTMRVLANGTELELSGGLQTGAAGAVAAMLNKYPNIRVIHLNSSGGLIAEGVDLYKLIQMKQLNTYVPTECSSICVLPFLAGDRRYIGKRGLLGFNSLYTNTQGVQIPAATHERFREAYQQQGIAGPFTRRALNMEHVRLWYPSHIELLAANVIHTIAEADQFASSTVAHPQDVAITARHLVMAPSRELVTYWQTKLNILNYLNYTNANSCVDYLYPDWHNNTINRSDGIPVNLLDTFELAAVDLIEATDVTQEVNQPITVETELSMQSILAQLEQQSAEYIDALNAPQRYRDQPEVICSANIALYQQILLRPQLEERAGLLRMLYAQQESSTSNYGREHASMR